MPQTPQAARKSAVTSFPVFVENHSTSLEIYDALQQSIATGKPYQTFLNPPPADPRRYHLSKEVRTA